MGEISTYAQTKKKINVSNVNPQLWGLDLEDIERGGRLLTIKTVGERKAVGDKTIFNRGDILYSKLRPYLLKILVAPQGGICTPEIIPFTCYGNICNDYIVDLLKSPYVDNYINAVTFGVKMPRVGTETIISLPIPLPPSSEQQRIVAKIEELMPLVEQYGKAQSELEALNRNIREQLRKSVLQYAIEGKLVPQCEEDGTAEDLLQEIHTEKQRLYTEGKLKKKDLTHSTIFRGEDNKYFEKKGEEFICIDEEIPFDIPDSWEWVRLGCISKFSIGKTPERGNSRYWENGVYPWVSISDMKPNEYIHSTREKVSQDAVDKCFGDISPKGSLLMSFKLTIGRTSILQMESYHNEAIVTLTPFIDLNYTLRNYLFYILPVTSNMGESNDAIKGKTLNSKSLFNILIPLPPLIEQQKIIHKIEVVASIMSR